MRALPPQRLGVSDRARLALAPMSVGGTCILRKRRCSFALPLKHCVMLVL